MRFGRKRIEERSANLAQVAHDAAFTAAEPIRFGGFEEHLPRKYPGPSAAARTGAAEVCSSWWARALASATVTGDVRGVVTAKLLSQIGGALIRQGEVCYLIVVEGSGVSLVPASSFWVEGGSDPSGWRYHVIMNGPSGTSRATAPASGVVHMQWHVTPATPWRGQSPLVLAREASRRAWASETRLADLASVQIGQQKIIHSDDWEDVVEFSESYKAGQRDPSKAGSPGFANKRIEVASIDSGLAPEQADVENGRDALLALAACCGIPATLVGSPSASGSSASGREDYRRFLFGSVAPTAKLVSDELSSKLDSPDLSLSFEELRAGDIVSRSRAFMQLTKSGYPPAMAAAQCGLEPPPDIPTTAIVDAPQG